MTVDNSGNFLVTDTVNNRVQKFSPGGTFLLVAGGTTNPVLNGCQGVAPDKDGSFYVSDFNNARIVKYDTFGNYLFQFGSSGSSNGQFGSPAELLVDYNHNLLVSDTRNFRLELFSPSGSYLNQLLTWTNDTGYFFNPCSMAIDSKSNLYVVDAGMSVVFKFNSNYNFIYELGTSYSSAIGNFASPYSVCVDSNDFLYVADTANSRIQKFDSSGNFVTSWGSFGAGTNNLNYPRGVAVDSKGYLYVSDYGNNRIVKFDNAGNYKSSFGQGILVQPYQISIDSFDRIMVADFHPTSGSIQSRVCVFAYPPTLKVSLGSPGQIVFSWPISAVGFQLYTSNAGGPFVNSGLTPTVVGENYQINQSLSSLPGNLFRLYHP